MKYIFIVLLLLCNACALLGVKIVGLVPVRNEQTIIRQSLKALACYTDAIVVLDDCSTDDTVTIIKSLQHECSIAKIITKNSWYRDEPGDKNRLLKAGREIGGTHFIVLDADEMLTSNLLVNNFLRTYIMKLHPGDKLSLCWIQLWRSVDNYRFDNSVWTWNYKTVIFADNGSAAYNSEFIHTRPIPDGLYGRNFCLKGYQYGLLHFQFVNWHNLLTKQSWYRCLERIRFSYKSAPEINKKYAASKNEAGIMLKKSDPEWFCHYGFFDSSLYNKTESWRKKQVQEWFKAYGKDYFKGLDIWDIDWN